jgi:hypothetical protein
LRDVNGRRTRSSAIPAAIANPPMTCQRVRCSSRMSSANTTAKNGCRFATSDARDGPTRSMAVNHRMFVRNSGPTTAYPNASHTCHENDHSCARSCGRLTIASGTQPSASTSALIRNGE